MKRVVLFILIGLCMTACSERGRIMMTSPDGHVKVLVRTDDGVKWKVMHDDEVVLDWSPIGVEMQHSERGRICRAGGPRQITSVQYSHHDDMRPQVTYVKRATIRDHYNAAIASGQEDDCEDYRIEWRVYDDGAAYRIIPVGPCVRILNETAEWHFADDYEVLVPYENDLRAGETMCYAFESYYDRQNLSEMYGDSLAITPLCVTLRSGKRVIVGETNIRNYPGMFVKKDKGNNLCAIFPHVPTAYEVGGFTDLNLVPTERSRSIAEYADGEPTALPWRVVGVFAHDEDVLNSDMMQCLAQADLEPGEPTAPRGQYCGQTTWDWWNDWGLTGVGFKPGINNETYRYYARFAAEHGIRYMIVDDGWSDHGDLSQTKGEIDIPALVKDAEAQGVGVILWSSYRALRDSTEETMAYFAQLGVRGFKVDFFDRNDQVITQDVWRLAEVAARYGLLLDLHGYMPTGIQAVMPNVMSFEGVKGLENFKWEQMRGDSTEHDHPRNVVEVPFLRGFVGPYDYTPGSMRNATHAEFGQGGLHTIGTRCNQLAMYVVQEAPLQMLADSPTEYEANPEAVEMITSIPTIFDETEVIEARLGEYIVIARRSGEKWYVGAVTDQPRTIEVPLSFLDKGTYQAHIAEDGPEAERRASDVRYYEAQVTQNDTLTIRMAYAGGEVAIIAPPKGRINS